MERDTIYNFLSNCRKLELIIKQLEENAKISLEKYENKEREQ